MRNLPSVLGLVLLVPLLTAGEEPTAPAVGSEPVTTALEHPPAEDEAFMEAARAASLKYQNHLRSLRARLESDEEAERLEAIMTMSRLADPSLVQDLMPFLQQDVRSTAEVTTAITALANIGSQEVVAEFRRLTALKDATIREAAICGLARMEALGVNDYRLNLERRPEVIKADAAVGIALEKDTESGAKLVEALAMDDRPFIRQRAAIALGELGDVTHGPALATALTDPNPRVRRLAAEALVKLDYKPAIPKLIMALEANVAGIHLNRCLIRISGEDFGFNPLGGAVERMQAIERAFVWWTDQAEALGG